MQVDVRLNLPRDVSTVSVTRRILRCAMTALGVRADVRDDLEVALTEACGNVVRHAVASDHYEVTVGIHGDLCVIDVIDAGNGHDETTLRASMPHPSAEQGRGLHLIQALTENVRMDSHPRRGVIMHFEKKLTWEPDAPGIRLS